MQSIAALDHTEYAAEEAAFSTTDAQRQQPLRNWDQINAFQSCVHALDAWPLEDALTGWDVRLITAQCERDAQTAYLNRLANF